MWYFIEKIQQFETVNAHVQVQMYWSERNHKESADESEGQKAAELCQLLINTYNWRRTTTQYNNLNETTNKKANK